jgi:hypothetical protein
LRPTARSATTAIPSDCSSDAGPTPDSCSSCGVLTAPAHTTTSRFAVAVWERPRAVHVMLDARVPSKPMRVASALVSTTRFARRIAGRR